MRGSEYCEQRRQDGPHLQLELLLQFPFDQVVNYSDHHVDICLVIHGCGIWLNHLRTITLILVENVRKLLRFISGPRRNAYMRHLGYSMTVINCHSMRIGFR